MSIASSPRTTRTGYELAHQKYPQHLVAYCPLDFSWAVRRALRRFRPDLLVLTELELWPNLIRAADRAWRPGGDRQRSTGRRELSRLPADPLADRTRICGV